MSQNLVELLYLVSAALFILGLKGLTKVRTARNGNLLSAGGMFLAVLATLIALGSIDYRWIVGGFVVGAAVGLIAAVRVAMTSMPEMVALFNGFGGAASALVGMSTLWHSTIEPNKPGTVMSSLGGASAITLVLSILIGGVTLTGSVVAFLKLNGTMKGNPILLPGRHVLNVALLLGSLGAGWWLVAKIDAAAAMGPWAWGVLAASLVLGWLLVIPIGGADMPVVISLLNSYSGVAAAATGFVIGNSVLIVSGALVGASGLILTQIMCVAMNRSLANVLFGGFGAEASGGAPGPAQEYVNVRSCGAEEAAMVLESAESVVFVPGYGLAVAQAQHVTRELAELLEKRGARVTYAIHPVAGRMPGHMNVLLAEADVPYEQLIEMERINPELKNTDAVVVVGANDVVNPAAQTTPGSPIYGMPILEVFRAKTVFVIKRSLGAGFAGVKNELFEYPNTMMIYGDAKKVLQGLVTELKEAG
jgi:NAD(P) transhydrogenase subunit beta